MKQDEAEFRKLVLEFGRIPSDAWEALTKRQYYLLEKWTRKGWWDFGVSIRSGWLTDKGREEFKKMSESGEESDHE